jgi:pimeloyl-ACP methyl ester carboxylesterase
MVSDTVRRIGEFTEDGTSRTIEAGGMRIHYHDVGSGEPIVMLHSYGLGTTAWITFYRVLPYLTKHFRCIAMDLPNFAKTGPVVYNEPVHDFQAKTAFALMDALGIQRAHMLGNSDGGQACVAFACAHPERVNKLVWGAGHIGTSRGYAAEYQFTVEPEASEYFYQQASEDPTLENIRRYLSLHIRDETDVTDELVEYVQESYTGRPDLAEARKASRSLPSSHIDDFRKISAPTLMVWGRHDRRCNFEIGINALNHIHNSRLVLLHCGHWVPFERPEEYSSHVLNFLRGDWA